MAKLVIGNDKTNGVPAVVVPSGPKHYVEKTVDAYGILRGGNSLIDLTGVTNIGDHVLAYAYYKNQNISGAIDMSGLTKIGGSSYLNCCASMFELCNGITSINLGSVTGISGSSCYAMFRNCSNLVSADLHSLSDVDGQGCQYMFSGCTSLTSVRLDSLTNMSGNSGLANMFRDCTSLTSIDLSKLVSTSSGSEMASMFYRCTHLTSVDLSSLTSVGYRGMQEMFYNCSSLQTMKFESLSSIVGNQALQKAFSGCSSLGEVWFYALNTSSFGTQTGQFDNMLQLVTGCTVHFPIAIQSTIGSWTDVTNGFGGTNTTVLFDIVTGLVGTDTSTYTRKQKESTSTATAWIDGNDVLFYTSGTTEPQVGDTIYSDSACTTAVTTISSIA